MTLKTQHSPMQIVYPNVFILDPVKTSLIFHLEQIFEHLKPIPFHLEQMEKLMVFVVSILKHILVDPEHIILSSKIRVWDVGHFK